MFSGFEEKPLGSGHETVLSMTKGALRLGAILLLALSLSGGLLGCTTSQPLRKADPREDISLLPTDRSLYFYLDYSEYSWFLEEFIPRGFTGEIEQIFGTLRPGPVPGTLASAEIFLRGRFSPFELGLGLRFTPGWHRRESALWQSDEGWILTWDNTGLIRMILPADPQEGGAAPLRADETSRGPEFSPEAVSLWGEAPGVIYLKDPLELIALPPTINPALEEALVLPSLTAGDWLLAGQLLFTDERSAQAFPRLAALLQLLVAQGRGASSPVILPAAAAQMNWADMELRVEGRRVFFEGLTIPRKEADDHKIDPEGSAGEEK